MCSDPSILYLIKVTSDPTQILKSELVGIEIVHHWHTNNKYFIFFKYDK